MPSKQIRNPRMNMSFECASGRRDLGPQELSTSPVYDRSHASPQRTRPRGIQSTTQASFPSAPTLEGPHLVHRPARLVLTLVLTAGLTTVMTILAQPEPSCPPLVAMGFSAAYFWSSEWASGCQMHRTSSIIIEHVLSSCTPRISYRGQDQYIDEMDSSALAMPWMDSSSMAHCHG